MTIATLPPSNHLNAIRAFVSQMRRTWSLPTAQEIAHAEDSIAALDRAINTKIE
jgi:hypothetical protein